MADEHESPNEEVSQEERKKSVITEGALDLALEMESIDKKIIDIYEEMRDVDEMMQELAAKRKQLEGKRDAIRAKFWKSIRADERGWFRRMMEAGLVVTYKRVKNPDTDLPQIELTAFSAEDEAYKQLRRIFRRDEKDEK